MSEMYVAAEETLSSEQADYTNGAHESQGEAWPLSKQERENCEGARMTQREMKRGCIKTTVRIC